MSDIAVVILNWNGLPLLKEFLPRVVENSRDADVIVADNASTDGSMEWVKEFFPTIRTLEFDENHGFAGGYNRAIARLENYEYIVLLNSDAAPAPGWIEPLKNSFSQRRVVAVQPKLLSEKDHRMFEYAGAAGGFLDRNGYPYCRGRIFDTVEADEGQYETSDDIFWASGAALAVRRQAYVEAGGLDEEFFAHMEEIDLCWRMKLRGGRIVYQPKSIVYHVGGASLDASSPRKTYLNFRNNLLMLHKNLPAGARKNRLLFRRRLLDTAAWAKFVVGRKWDHAKALIKAHRDFSSMRGRYKEFPNRNLLSEECRRNILVDYYLRRKRTF